MDDLLTGKIIAAAYKVYNALGFGFLEKVYKMPWSLNLAKASSLFPSKCL